MKIGLAFRAFFLSLFNREKAEAIESALKNHASKGITEANNTKPGEVKPRSDVAPLPVQLKAGRSDALTLLAVLQREARFIDLVQEPLANYNDAQVGAAARDVIQQTSKVLQRMFDIQPLSKDGEGTVIDRPSDASSARWKPIGDAMQKSKVAVVHPGWVANAMQVPVWTGSKEDQGILMPTEIE